MKAIDPDDPSLMHFRSPKSNGSESIGHVLQFTARLKGIRRDQYYSVDTHDSRAEIRIFQPTSSRRWVAPEVQFPDLQSPRGLSDHGGLWVRDLSVGPNPSSLFTTNWAEVTYFVRRNGDFAGKPTPLQPLSSTDAVSERSARDCLVRDRDLGRSKFDERLRSALLGSFRLAKDERHDLCSMAKPWSRPRVGDSVSIRIHRKADISTQLSGAAQIPTMTDLVGGQHQ